MKSKTLVRRYTRGLVNSIVDEKEFKEIHKQLLGFYDFLSKQKELEHILTKSLLPPARKRAIGEEVLNRPSLHPKTSRFLLLLISNNRLELLSGIFESLPGMWNEEQGISSFEVSSVVPLSDSQMEALRLKLERMEKRPVSLDYKINPELIGGVSIRQGNIVYDASLRGALVKLKEKITEG